MKRILAPYIALFIAAMGALVLASPWREIDWMLYARWNPHPPSVLSKDILIVDVPHDADRARFRARVCDLLRTLGTSERALPRAIALDVQIENEAAGLTQLEECIGQIQAKGVKVYAAANPLNASGNVTTGFLERHASRLYRQMLDGFGHTRFDHLHGMAKYDPYLRLSDALSIPSLPIKLAEDLLGRPIVRDDGPVVLFTGDIPNVQRLQWRNEALTGECLAQAQCLQGKILVVGALAADITPLAGYAGPELLAWALSERMLPADLAAPRPLINGWLLLALIVLFSLLTLIILGALLKRLPLGVGVWLPALAAAISIALLAALLSGLRAMHIVYPQITLVAAAIVLSAMLSVAFLRKRALATELNASLPAEEARYDIFISYSRTPDNAQWVAREVYEPLKSVTLADGSPARIFFDTKSLRVGVYWYTELTRAIAASRVFVAVYSEDYFTKGFCRFELERAFIREATAPGFVLPLTRGSRHIPPQYAHVQCLDSEADTGFVEQLKSTIEQRLRTQNS